MSTKPPIDLGTEDHEPGLAELQTLIEVLLTTMDSSGITREQVAETLDVSVATLREYERNPTKERVMQYASGVGKHIVFTI